MTKLLIGILVVELWCYMHEAYDKMAYLIGGLIICVIYDTITNNIRHIKKD